MGCSMGIMHVHHCWGGDNFCRHVRFMVLAGRLAGTLACIFECVLLFAGSIDFNYIVAAKTVGCIIHVGINMD